MRRLLLLAALAGGALWGTSAGPAHGLAVEGYQSVWTSGGGGAQCLSAGCAVTAVSNNCATVKPYLGIVPVNIGVGGGSCTAVLNATILAMAGLPADNSLCTGVAVGVLDFTGSPHPFSIPVVVTFEAGHATFTGGGPEALGAASTQGAIVNACTPSGTFSGVVERTPHPIV